MEPPRVVVVAEVVVPAVVSAEEDDRVPVQAKLLQQAQHLAHIPVHHRDHRRVALRLLGPGLVLVELPCRVSVGDVEDPVRRRDGQVAEERLLGIGANELQRLLHDDGVRVGLPLAGSAVPRKRHLLAVADDVLRVVRVRVDLVVVAEEVVEPVLFGHARRAASAAAPLPIAPGRVAGALEHRGHRLFALTQRRTAPVSPHRGVSAVLARHQAAARRRTHRRARQRLGEADSLSRHAVDVGGLDVGVPHARELIVAQLIGHDVDHIRGPGCPSIGLRVSAWGCRRQGSGGAGCRSQEIAACRRHRHRPPVASSSPPGRYAWSAS